MMRERLRWDFLNWRRLGEPFMMLGLRLVFGLLLLTALGLLITAWVKRDPRWQRLAIRVLMWTLAAALGFFAVLIAEHLLSG